LTFFVQDADAHFQLLFSQLPRNSCSVGWKFVGNEFGGGYVSGDDNSEDKINLDATKIGTDDLDRDSQYGEEGSLAPSLSESIFSSGYDPSRVPFQEVIDLAIRLM
jgi:hypothetical protein